MFLVSCSGETIHPPVDSSLKTKLTVAICGLQRGVMNIEKPNSDLHSLTMAGIQSNVFIFCKIILNFLGQQLTPNYPCHLLTLWYIVSHSCKPLLSQQSKNIDFFSKPLDTEEKTGPMLLCFISQQIRRRLGIENSGLSSCVTLFPRKSEITWGVSSLLVSTRDITQNEILILLVFSLCVPIIIIPIHKKMVTETVLSFHFCHAFTLSQF